MRVGPIALACFAVIAAPLLAAIVPARAASPGERCAVAPKSPLVVNVKDKGAKGDGKTDDTAAIQAAIDQVAGSGGTVLVPDGVYMIDVTADPRLSLKDNMTLKLADGATLKAIPNDQKKYSVLMIRGASNVTVIGGSARGNATSIRAKREAGAWASTSAMVPSISSSQR